ncbi:MAG: hypothetical protein Kow0027_23960 [Saprospiraceae bacterium]
MESRKVFIILTMMAWLPGTLVSQHPVDSLKALLPQAKEDTAKVVVLADIAFYLFNSDPEQSLEYSTQALQLARQLNYPKGEVNAWYKQAIAYYAMGAYDKGIEAAEQALRISEETDYDRGKNFAYNILGVIYRTTSNAEKAVEYAFKSAELSKSEGDTLSEATAYSNIGTIYLDFRDTINARKYFLKALETFRTANATVHLTEVLTNLSAVASDTTQKLAYIEESIQLGHSIDYENALAYGYHNLASFVWKNRRQARAAVPLYRKAASYGEKTKDFYETTLLYNDLGALYLELGRIDSAAYFLEKGLAQAEEQQMTEQIREAKDELSKVYAARGDYAKAYRFLRESAGAADSLFREEMARQLADADARFETSKKEAQIAEQQLEIARQRNSKNRLIMGGLLVLLLAAGIFQYLFYKQRRRKKETELALAMEQREAARLRELDEMKTRFFTNISHELRTPLTLIISPLEEVLRQLRQVNLQPHLETALRNSRNLHKLINEILDLAKMEAGQVPVQHSDVPVKDMLRRILYSFQSSALVKGVELVDEIEETDRNIRTDVPKLEKILNNLLANALRFTPAGGKVVLKSRLEGKQLTVAVSDTGPGIAEADQQRIFDRYYQSSSNGSAAGGGTGIGLALCKQLTEILGGRIGVQSKPGAGSTFTVELPVEVVQREDATKEPKAPRPLPEEKETASAPAFAPSGRKPRILIVEDNREMSDFLSSSLSKNYDCQVAFDGAQALELLTEASTPPYDLITSDVMMPNMDGFTLREKINEHDSLRKIPFILLTARSLEADKLKGFQLGVDDYITKPFSLPELEARIQNLLNNKQQREQWQQQADGSDEQLSSDEQLLQQAEAIVRKHMDDPTFNVEVLAREIGYTSRHMSRVLGRLTGLTPVQFILEIRLQHARQLLESRRFATVAEVQYEIGIESPSYFSRKFNERFGKSPGALLKEVS